MALRGICVQPKSNVSLCSHGLYFLSWHYSLRGEFGSSVCVIWLRELEELVF